MAIRVYNTLTRRKEEFVPRQEGKVGIYVCGITPYSTSHIGHSRFVVLWDTIRRYLEYKGMEVTVVQNFTDVEDKLIEASRETGKLPMQIAQKHIKGFLKDVKDLGALPPQYQPRASQHIDDIIAMVETLIEKDHAYVVGGDVYFSVESFPAYGKLSGRDPEDVLAGARVEIDARKRDPRDFALWKSAKPGEPAWPSPWGPGRPGWHIECSAMSLKYLGEGFDFHGGGTDLIFPHHENEIAQSEAFLGRPNFARNWVHHEMINTRTEKMSKSLGNVVTIRQALDRFPGQAIRYFLLSTHYRKILEFSSELLEEATKGWDRLQKSANEGAAYLWAAGWRSPRRGAVRDQAPGPLAEKASRARTRFEEAMDDDFNTAQACGVLFDLAKDVNTAAAALTSQDMSRGAMDDFAVAVNTLMELGAVLGLIARPRFQPSRMLQGVLAAHEKWAGTAAPPRKKTAEAVRESVDSLMRLRDNARARKAWDVADGIRKHLAQAGIKVEDSRTGSKWRPEVL